MTQQIRLTSNIVAPILSLTPIKAFNSPLVLPFRISASIFVFSKLHTGSEHRERRALDTFAKLSVFAGLRISIIPLSKRRFIIHNYMCVQIVYKSKRLVEVGSKLRSAVASLLKRYTVYRLPKLK